MFRFLMLLRPFKGLVNVIKAENGDYLRAESGAYIQYDTPTEEPQAPEPPLFV